MSDLEHDIDSSDDGYELSVKPDSGKTDKFAAARRRLEERMEQKRLREQLKDVFDDDWELN